MRARPRFLSTVLAGATGLALGAGALVAAPAFAAAPAAAAASVPPPLVVTEINPDNVGSDQFEFFEVYNTTDAPLALDGAFGFAYIYADTDDRARDVALAPAAGTVVPAHAATVFWLDYTATGIDTSVLDADDFAAHYGGTAGYPVVKVTGQAGMANGGNRGIRITDAAGTAVSRSFYPTGSAGADRSVHFAVPADSATASAPVQQTLGAPTPGVVAAEQLPAAPEPEPTPDPTPTPTPTTPAPAPGPQPDPALVTAPLQVTELLPDSSNLGGGDAYEFIELYNATSEAVDFSDYTLRYLYPLEDLSNSQTALWPVEPANPVIPAGGTLVVWVKNGTNDALTPADFNTKFGTALTLGQNLVETRTAGMANSSARGIEIITNTGQRINRAYYNLAGADDTTADQGIQYAVDPKALTRQTLVKQAPASPGSVTADQVPAGLMVPPADHSAPVVTDTSPTVVKRAADLPFHFEITDDVLVRTVTLHWKTNADAGYRTVNLENDGSNGYGFTVPAVDLTGARSVDYFLTASDGAQTTTLPAVHLTVEGANDAPLRLNVTDGQFVGGKTLLSAATDHATDTVGLSIDGAAVATTPALESEPSFAFDASGVNVFFKNGVRIGDDVLRIFDDGIPSGYETISTSVPLSYVTQGKDLVVSVWAGTKAAPVIDPNENNDDFTIKNLRLVLPDGRTLTPVGYDDPSTVLQMGDSTGKLDYYDAHFVLPDDAFSAKAAVWDTTAVADGAHTVVATSGVTTASAAVTVDNTAPALTTTLTDGTEYRGAFSIDATATDAGSGLATQTATLDGSAIRLPYSASSVTMASGSHAFVITATDALGNAATKTVAFTTPDEQPGTEPISPVENAIESTRDVTLSAEVTDPSGDVLDASFAEGYHLDPSDAGVTSWKGETGEASGTDRSARTPVSAEELAAMTGTDGIDASVSTDAAFPYQMFDVSVPATAGADALARLSWSGTANADAKVLMYVLDTATGDWEEVDRYVTGADSGDGSAAGSAASDAADAAAADSPASFDLGATVPVAGHLKDGRIQVLVQHSEGFAGANLSTRDTAVAPFNAGATPRADYDFTLGWETDTQYYNDTFYQHQLDINRFFLKERANLNLQYVFHTGDVVDNSADQHQWDNADAAYRLFDDAKLPYGVLAGNHDVGHKEDDYTEFSKYFGASRYENNPWYGESYLDNRGHFDLITAGGIDFMVVSMGWDPGDAEIAWMNEVIAKYPERKVIINLHEYMLTTGGLGPIPQRIMDEVVATNPNVMMVMSGHYHDAYTRTDEFDDDGDGTPDRTVYAMLFDYQGLAEGGLGFLRLLHFDNASSTVSVRTYSPSLDQFDSDDPSFTLADQEFTIPYAAVGIRSATKTLATDAFSADILTTNEIASFSDVASGTVLSTVWKGLADGEHGWFVKTADPYGAVDYSAVRTFTVGGVVEEPGKPGSGSGSGSPGSGQTDPTSGSPENPASAVAPQSSGSLAATGVGDGAGQWLAIGLLVIALGALAVIRGRRRRLG
ncbi:lamin tail domain-containing protein [Herbiconiux solani]|uniref:lamin tail domain-containing protein n=1 Tax=Herbiconiux solani TaxID=661329 RepID=UPI000AF6DFFC|nr:lamin tail domain-containing protein [Herbiconiux solani]